MNKKEDIIILALRYGKEKLETGFTEQELTDYLKSQGYDRTKAKELFDNVFGVFDSLFRSRGRLDDSNKMYLSVESYFRLLEYDELQEARQSSKEAKYFAILAMVVSSVLALGSIIVGIWG